MYTAGSLHTKDLVLSACNTDPRLASQILLAIEAWIDGGAFYRAWSALFGEESFFGLPLVHTVVTDGISIEEAYLVVSNLQSVYGAVIVEREFLTDHYVHYQQCRDVTTLAQRLLQKLRTKRAYIRWF